MALAGVEAAPATRGDRQKPAPVGAAGTDLDAVGDRVGVRRRERPDPAPAGDQDQRDAGGVAEAEDVAHQCTAFEGEGMNSRRHSAGVSGRASARGREAAIDFLDRFGEDAIALGWTATDLFGVHPAVGVVRVDYCGALMISGERVRAIESDKIRFGMTTYYRNLPGRPVGVPVWEIGR